MDETQIIVNETAVVLCQLSSSRTQSQSSVHAAKQIMATTSSRWRSPTAGIHQVVESIKKEQVINVSISSKWGVEKSIFSEQWKVEGDDVSVSCESRRESLFWWERFTFTILLLCLRYLRKTKIIHVRFQFPCLPSSSNDDDVTEAPRTVRLPADHTVYARYKAATRRFVYCMQQKCAAGYFRIQYCEFFVNYSRMDGCIVTSRRFICISRSQDVHPYKIKGCKVSVWGQRCYS